MTTSSFDWGAAGKYRDDFTPIEVEGGQAYNDGCDRSDCPYPFGSDKQQQWACGFDNAQFANHGIDDAVRPGDRRPRNSARSGKSQQSPNWQRGGDSTPIWIEGAKAYDAGKRRSDCPYPLKSGREKEWNDGFNFASACRSGNKNSPDREPSVQAKRATPIHNPDRPKINAAGRFLVLTVMGTFTVLSQQVWIGYADTLLTQITRIPFLGLITQIPMAGGVVEFFGPWFPDLFGVGVWALINASQSGKHVIKLLDIRDPWWVTMLTDWSRPQYVALAYIAEILLNYDRFPLFKGGIDYLISSYENLDMDLFLWPNVFFLLISVLSFEWLVKFFTPKSISSKGKK